jgi:hypothetical protein
VIGFKTTIKLKLMKQRDNSQTSTSAGLQKTTRNIMDSEMANGLGRPLSMELFKSISRFLKTKTSKI